MVYCGVELRGHLLAGVDLVDHQGEIDGLRRQRLVGGDRSRPRAGQRRSRSGCGRARTARSGCGFRRAARGTSGSRCTWRCPRPCGAAATGEPSTEKYITLLMAPYSVASSLVVPGRIVMAAARFDADGVSAGGACRNGVREGVGAGSVAAALGGRDRVLGDVALGGHVRAEVGVAVVRGGTGEDQADAVAAAGHLRHGEAVAGVVLDREGDGRSLAGDAVVDLEDVDVDARDGRRLGVDDVRVP